MAGQPIVISILANATSAVRGLRRTTDEAEQMRRKIAALDAQVRRLNGRDARISFSTRGFVQGTAQIIAAHVALDRLQKGMPDLTFGLTGVAQKVALVAAAALTATAATLPLAGAVAGVAAAAVSAAAGVGLFAAVALPTIKAVTTAVGEYNTASHAFDRAQAIGDETKMAKARQDMASALGALTPAERAAAEQAIKVNEAWTKLSQSQAPTVLAVMTAGAQTFAGIVPRLTPAIAAMAGAFKGISTDVFALLTRSTGPFVDLVTTQGVPQLKSFAAILLNLAPTVGHLVTAFAPLGTAILTSLVPASAALSKFSFAGIAQAAMQLLPQVGALLSTIGGAVADLVRAAAPLAGPVLSAVTAVAGALRGILAGSDIAGFVNSIATILPAVAPILAVVGNALAVFANIIAAQLVPLVPQLLPLVQQLADVFVNVLAGVSPLLSPLLGLVGVVVSLLPVVYPLIVALRQALVPVVNALADALTAALPSISAIVSAFASALPSVSGLLVALVPIVPILLSALAPAIKVAADAVGVLAKALGPVVTSVLDALTPVLHVVVDTFVALVTALTPVLPVVARLAGALGVGLLTVVRALAPVLPTLTDAVAALAPVLTAILAAVVPVVPQLATLAATLITALLPAVLPLVPIIVQLATALGASLPTAIGILNPLLSVLISFAGTPVFAALAKAVLVVVAAKQLWAVVTAANRVAIVGLMVAQRAQAALLVAGRAAIVGVVVAMRAWMAITAATRAAVTAVAVVTRGWMVAMAMARTAVVGMAVATRGWLAATVASRIAVVATTVATRAWLAITAAVRVATAAWAAIQGVLNVALIANPIGIIIIAIVALIAVIVLIATKTTWFQSIWQGVMAGATAAINWIVEAAGNVMSWLGRNWQAIVGIVTGPVGMIVMYVVDHWEQIKTATVNAFNAVVDWLSAVPGRLLAVGRSIMAGLAQGIDDGMQWIRDKVASLSRFIPDWLKSELGIRSPSRVMAGLGANIMQGLNAGIAGQLPALRNTLNGVSAAVTGGLSATATVDLNTVGRQQIDTTGGGTGRTYVIHNNIAPGADLAEVGRQTVRAIEAHERQSGRRRLAVAL